MSPLDGSQLEAFTYYRSKNERQDDKRKEEITNVTHELTKNNRRVALKQAVRTDRITGMEIGYSKTQPRNCSIQQITKVVKH